jgi:Trypsin
MAATGGQVREADEVVRADGFDLALIHFPSVSGIRPLPMADRKGSSALYKNGTVGLAVGWGRTASGKPATQLQEGAMKVEDQVYTFAQTMPRYDYLMKASPYRGKIAGGDSGGPLINEHVVNGVVTHTVIGVVSQGSKSDAAAYTKVGSVQPWIRQYLNKTAVTVPTPAPPAPTPAPTPVTPTPAPPTSKPPVPVNREPAIGAVRPAAGAVTASTTPTLSVTATDPDGDALRRLYRVFSYGDALFLGSLPGTGPKVSDIIGMARTPTSRGYWLVGRDGGVFAFGDAPFAGSLPGLKVKVGNIVGMAPTRSGKGYWLVGSDGGVFAFGNARFFGSMGGKPLNGRVTGMSATPDEGGYWLTGCDGGVFAFGDAEFRGSHATFQCRGVS